MHQQPRSSPVGYFQAFAHAQASGPGDHGTTRYLFGGLQVWPRPLPSAPETAIELYWVGASQPGCGEGSAGMQALADLADRTGVKLQLYADPWGQRGRMGRDALRHWYERFGFKATTGDLVAYWPHRLGLEMLRRPRGSLYGDGLQQETSSNQPLVAAEPGGSAD